MARRPARPKRPTLFDRLYAAAVTEAVEPPRARRRRSRRELAVRAAPVEATALGGCVLTPAQALDRGYVVIEGREIKAVQKTKPQGVKVHETGGVIVPGLIDLHGHPEFNVFEAWEPPRQFPNRYAWRGSSLYKQLVRDPQNRI